MDSGIAGFVFNNQFQVLVSKWKAFVHGDGQQAVFGIELTQNPSIADTESVIVHTGHGIADPIGKDLTPPKDFYFGID